MGVRPTLSLGPWGYREGGGWGEGGKRGDIGGQGGRREGGRGGKRGDIGGKGGERNEIREKGKKGMK